MEQITFIDLASKIPIQCFEICNAFATFNFNEKILMEECDCEQKP